MKKGQVSTELLIIVGVVLLVFIPLLAMVYFKAAEANEQIGNYQAELTVFRLAYMVNSVGSLGEDTSVYTDTYIPRNVKSLEFRQSGNGGEITMKVQTPQGIVEISEPVKSRLDDNTTIASPKAGWARFKVTNENTEGFGEVSIEQVK